MHLLITKLDFLVCLYLYEIIFYRDWIFENSFIAKEKYEMTNATREQVDSLAEQLRNTYGIKEVGKIKILKLYKNLFF